MAMTANESCTSSAVVLGPTAGLITGATFTSLTVIVTSCEAVPPCPSETCTVTVCVPSCASVGVHVKLPPCVMEAPGGRVVSSSEKNRSSPLRSVAVTLNVIGCPSFTVLEVMVSNTGDTLALATVMVS